MSVAKGHAGFHLLDASALVVGYGLASLLVRAFWPQTGTPPVAQGAVIALVFLWLGLAMSGPVVLLIRRSPALARVDDEDDRPTDPRTWAELAWLIIGFYWIGLTVLVVPIRMPGTRFVDSAVLGLFPVLAALGLRLFGPRGTTRAGDTDSWTHRVGVILLVTWPFAWLALILLGKSV